jgi:hypothetical protein
MSTANRSSAAALRKFRLGATTSRNGQHIGMLESFNWVRVPDEYSGFGSVRLRSAKLDDEAIRDIAPGRPLAAAAQPALRASSPRKRGEEKPTLAAMSGPGRSRRSSFIPAGLILSQDNLRNRPCAISETVRNRLCPSTPFGPACDECDQSINAFVFPQTGIEPMRDTGIRDLCLDVMGSSFSMAAKGPG